MKTLSETQQQIIISIYEHQTRSGSISLPTLVTDLGAESVLAVRNQLESIRKKGWLQSDGNRATAILLKNEAVDFIKRDLESFRSPQLNFSFTGNDVNNSLAWTEFSSSSNITIHNTVTANHGQITFLDCTHIINCDSSSVGEDGNQIWAVEQLNWNELRDLSKSEFLEKFQHPVIVSSTLPILHTGKENSITNGFSIIEGDNTYQMTWCGVKSGHYFHYGKEVGDTSSVSIIDANNGQSKLFPTVSNPMVINDMIDNFSQEMRKWSRYVDFPIYGGAQLHSGQTIYWSRPTAKNIKDLRYYFLLTTTGTTFVSGDKALKRDLLYTNPYLITN